MHGLLRKVETKILNKKVFAWFLILFVVVMMAPLLYIGRYNHMSGDCYWYGFQGYVAWLNTHSIFRVMGAGIRNAVKFWHTWQGTYSSIFMFTITPGLFGEQYSFIVPYMMIGMTFFSNFILFYVLLVKVMKAGPYHFLIFFLMSFFMQIEFMYTPASGLYWYNGAVHYVFMQGFVYIAVSCVLMYFYRLAGEEAGKRKSASRWIPAVLAAVFGFIASGANFSSALLNFEFYSLFLAVMLYFVLKKRKKRALCYLIPYGITLGGFLLNIMAPGNGVRQAYFVRMGAVKAVLQSLAYSFSQAGKWIDIFVVLCLLMLVPFILKFAWEGELCFRFAPAAAILSYCLYASMFTPGFYAQGAAPISRNQNICKMFLFVILVLNEIYLLGWLTKKMKKRLADRTASCRGTGKWAWSVYLCVLAVLFAAFFFRLDFVPKKAAFVSYGAWDVIVTGDGKQYHREYLNRLALYKNSEEKVIYVAPYSVQPYPIWVNSDSEVSNQENGLLNTDMAVWYQKDAIYEKKGN